MAECLHFAAGYPDVYPHVVPANAGTHNHRRQLLEEAVDHPAKTTTAAAYGSRIALRLSGTTTEYDFAISPHHLPELCISFRPNKRAQGMPGAG
jgi:hypothetical protein